MARVVVVTMAVVAFVCVAGRTVRASADANVDEGCSLVNRGEFRVALAALGRAESSRSLDRESLVRLLECRALARFATRDLDALEEDLVRLVSLDPGYTLSDDFGPEVHAMMDRVRARGPEALSVVVDVSREDGHATISARVEGDEGNLVREVRVRARVGRGPWRVGTDVIEVAAGDDATIEYQATAIGPGNAALERTEGRAGPAGARRPVRGPVRTPRTIDDDDDDDGASAPIWPWLVVGGAAAVAIGITAAIVVASSGSDLTQPSVPTVADWR